MKDHIELIVYFFKHHRPGAFVVETDCDFFKAGTEFVYRAIMHTNPHGVTGIFY